MKIVCDCGNEMEFIPDNEDDINSEGSIEEKGYYCKKDYAKFDFWATHDETGIVCKKCGKGIWYFT